MAVVGNPNTGKSTLFNALTGFRQRVANYPGVTVERRSGPLRGAPTGCAVEVIDLPGTYSFAAQSADEAVVLDVLLGRAPYGDRPDVIICVLDACHLRRNLFFASQVLALGRPVVLALNMIDLAEADGIRIDAAALSRALDVPVVPVVATRGEGVEPLTKAVLEAFDGAASGVAPPWPAVLTEALEELEAQCGRRGAGDGCAGVELLQALLEPGGYHEQRLVRTFGPALGDALRTQRERVAAGGEPIAQIEARVRYDWLAEIVARVEQRSARVRRSRTDALDRVLTHRVVGLGVLVAVLGVMFQAVYTWAGPLMDSIEAGFGLLGTWAAALLPEGALRSLVVDGFVAGVGGVLVFLPQILLLFFFIALLEDCGYLSRAALLMDRWMSALGLSGKAVIPLLSSFACAVPGIMATRTIEDRRTRMVTMLIAPLMSCSAWLPVYVLLIGAFVPDRPVLGGLVGLRGLVLLGMYLVGVAVAVPTAWLLKRTALRGPSMPLLIELPSYKWPSPKMILFRMYDQGKAFVWRAGTIIVACAIVVWALGYYPRPASVIQTYAAQRTEATQWYEGAVASFGVTDRPASDEARAGIQHEYDDLMARIDSEEAGALLRASYLGRMGAWVEPAVRPLGWDWRIGTAVIASFPAREVVIATLGTIYNLGSEQDEESADLRAALAGATWPDGRPVFTTAVALSVMVFFALCCQCASTLAVIRRESNSWRWPAITFFYMTGLAYVAALVTYQVATRLG